MQNGPVSLGVSILRIRELNAFPITEFNQESSAKLRNCGTWRAIYIYIYEKSMPLDLLVKQWHRFRCGPVFSCQRL